MSGPGWDTRSPVTRRPGGRDRLALFFGISLLVVAVLAALTGKVLASNPPTLGDSSPAADHTGQKAQVSSSKPPDPESLFLDLPDPPPPSPKATSRNSASQSATPTANSSEGKGVRTRGPGRPDRAERAGRPAGVASDIPVSKADFRPLPSSPTVKPGSGRAEDLLADPDCKFSDVARADLEAGVVDEYLISTLQAVCRKHSISVNVFKTGHTFGPGLVEGPKIPAGYGNAGGYPNTHYFGRAADIWEVDGKPVEGNGADPSVVSVGRILAGLPTRDRPDVVIGPDAWNQVLGYGPEQGWVIDQDQVALHADHLHVGYWKGDGTPPPKVFLSPEQEPFYTNSAPVRSTGNQAENNTRISRSGATRSGATRSSVTRSSVTRSSATRPKSKQNAKPVESPRPSPKAKARPKTTPGVIAATQEPKGRKETSRLRTIIRKVQRTETKDTSPDAAKKRSTNTKETGKKPGDPRPPKPTPDRDTGPPAPGTSSPEDPNAGATNSSSQYSAEPAAMGPDDARSEGTTPGDEAASGKAGEAR